ncbi:unnamed protein product [Rotaria sp. Silwood2]|nr:unnamed protein product [Rotaria sp. Silwood2]CAF3308991.1 unnamed protein product [Rotaria sp. Silwood2]CAF4292262.1 unnamed protein product [Rotaria sp. Silwood2]CAF4345837.1 unnamed protein product [Rotaria sp. Silwood2]
MICFILLGGIIAVIVVAVLSSTKTMTTIATTKRITTTVSTKSTITTQIASVFTTSTTTTTTETTAVTTIITTSSCSPSCNSQQTCIQSVCLNVGHLAFALTWSQIGDGDIVVTTPNGKAINYQNEGPSSSTDQGILDRDDSDSIGPENIYWSSSSSLPPTGTYYLCFEPYSFNPTISSSNPLTVTYHVVRSSGTILNITKIFTSTLSDSYNCDATSSTLVGSFSYP